MPLHHRDTHAIPHGRTGPGVYIYINSIICLRTYAIYMYFCIRVGCSAIRYPE